MPYTLGLGLLFLSFLQDFSTAPWRAVHSELFAFLAVVLWGWSAMLSRTMQVRLTPPVTALLCLALLVGLQYVGGQIYFGGDAVAMLVYIQLCLGAVLLGQIYAEDPKWPQALALALLLAALGSALVALAQVLWVWNDYGWILSTSGYRRPGANIGQPNHLATLLVMGAASLIYLDQRLEISRPTLVLLSLLLLMGMGITESRTGLLSGVALSVWWFLRRRVFAPMPKWPWIGCGVVALITWMWIWPLVITSIHELGLTASGVGLNTAAGTRLQVWQQLWEAIWIKPWLGWGLLGTPVALSTVLEAHQLSEAFTYAHNIILDMAIGMGVPLTVLALVVLVIWGVARLRSVRTPEAWYAVGLLVPFVIHSLLEYPFAYAYFLVPAMLAVGILERNYSPSGGKRISRKVFAGYVIVFTGLLMAVAVEYMAVEEDFVVARFEALNVGKTAADYERPHIVLLTQLRALLEVTRTVPNPNMTPTDLQLLRATASRFTWVSVQNCYALSAALNGNVPEAQRQLKVMRAMYGESRYQAIRLQWDTWAQDKYPQLQGLAPP